MKSEICHPSILLTCPHVGEGNPSLMYATASTLQFEGYPANPLLLEKSAWLARRFHRKMTRSPGLSRAYSKNGDLLRKGAKVILGTSMLAELAARIESLSIPGPSAYEYLIGVQEHQFGVVSKDFLAEKFPRGRLMPIGDVEPKQSAVDIMQAKGFTPLVWNQQALEKLLKLGLSPQLIKPLLPWGFFPGECPNLIRGEHFAVKASGSDMPLVYLMQLQKALGAIDYPYKIDLSEDTIHHIGKQNRAASMQDRIQIFYNGVFRSPAALDIGYPCELVMVKAALGQRMAFFPPRGPHEVTNLEWATHHGISLGMVDPENDKDLEGKLRDMYAESILTSVCNKGMGLGVRELGCVLAH